MNRNDWICNRPNIPTDYKYTKDIKQVLINTEAYSRRCERPGGAARFSLWNRPRLWEELEETQTSRVRPEACNVFRLPHAPPRTPRFCGRRRRVHHVTRTGPDSDQELRVYSHQEHLPQMCLKLHTVNTFLSAWTQSWLHSLYFPILRRLPGPLWGWCQAPLHTHRPLLPHVQRLANTLNIAQGQTHRKLVLMRLLSRACCLPAVVASCCDLTSPRCLSRAKYPPLMGWGRRAP